ncbi:hypothetical protein K492DRAFT_233060 [Lichtheimia hyalospora FSU 10163]|nr:hypothetical protein K492DRAFT_233060 [Lichtheimia hyalospora FSU 10163]
MEPMQVDAPAANAAPMTLEVLSLINDSRMTYGLRHQDYQRYREYCAHRVRRLRQLLELTKPNNKQVNQQKPLPETFSDARFLHLYVFEVERAWAHSMELKQESSSSMDMRKRHHLRKRLKKASKHADALSDLCDKQSVESRSTLDVKAYAARMKGYLLVEQQEWQAALDQFIIARVIYDGFGTATDNPQQEALCYAAIDDIDPNIRFCAYKLQLDTSNIPQLVNDLQKKNSMVSTLEPQLLQITQSSKKERPTLKWRGTTIVLRNDTVVKALEAAQQKSEWNEAEKVVKKAVKDDKEATAKVASSQSAKSTQDLQSVYAYVIYNSNARIIHRNIQSALQAKSQDAVRLFDDILQIIQTLRELPVNDDLATAFEAEMDVLEHYYRGYRCMYVAQVYGDLERAAESVAMYQRAQTYMVQTKQQLQRLNGFQPDTALTVTEEDLSKLEQQIRSGSWKMHAAWHLAQDKNNGTSELSSKMEQLKLNNDSYLIDDLDSYPAGLTQDSAMPKLVPFPPKLEAVVAKPFYFDLAANHVQYPDSLTLRAEDRSSGLFSKFFGFGKS